MPTTAIIKGYNGADFSVESFQTSRNAGTWGYDLKDYLVSLTDEMLLGKIELAQMMGIPPGLMGDAEPPTEPPVAPALNRFAGLDFGD
jgi:hypothetical protein